MSSAGRKLVLLVLLASPAWAQAPVFNIYPTRAATINDLTVAANNAITSLTSTLNPGDTTANVVSTALFFVPTILFVESGTSNAEAIICLTKTASSFTGCTRGQDNTTATTHSSGRPVQNNVAAYHYNLLANQIMAIQNDLLAGSAVVRGGLGLTSGTKGGLLCFVATTTLASTAAFGANAIVVGGSPSCPVGSLANIATLTGDISTPGLMITGVGSANAGFSLWQPGTSAFPLAGRHGVAWGSPATVPVDYEVTLPSAIPAATGLIGQHIVCPSLISSVSTCTWVTDPLTGLSGALGGSALASGACAAVTVAVTGATTNMAVMTTPVVYPGDGFWWEGYVSAAGTVTVRVCASKNATPTTSTYQVRLVP